MRDRRQIEQILFKGLMRLSTLIVAMSLVLIIGTIVVKGLPSMSLAMITKTSKGGFYLGGEGGILNAILGSLYLALGATVLSSVVAFPLVLYLNLYIKSKARLSTAVRFSLDVLFGIPSIVYGAFGFTIMIFLGLRASLLSGILTVAILELPIIARAIDEVMRVIPTELKEASYSLGATKLETGMRVIMRQALPGILTGMLIGLGRGIGDAASVMFTAGFTDSIPTSLSRPVATLPLTIFGLLGNTIPEVRERAYAAAFVLTVLILLISMTARLASRRMQKHVIK